MAIKSDTYRSTLLYVVSLTLLLLFRPCRLVARYVNLTDTIAVPIEWSDHVFQKFLVPLAEQVIDAVNASKPLALIKEVVSLYVIDVIFYMNDKNMEAMNDVARPEPHNPNALEH